MGVTSLILKTEHIPSLGSGLADSAKGCKGKVNLGARNPYGMVMLDQTILADPFLVTSPEAWRDLEAVVQ
jgi:hypothetical protein